MQESRLVEWFVMLDEYDNKRTLTFRQSDKESAEDFIERIEGYVVLCMDRGWRPLTVAPATTPKPETHDHAFNPPLPLEELVETKRTELESIPVETIEFAGLTKNEDKRWIVKGGWATKFGITAFHDVLEAAGLGAMPTDKVNAPTGNWTAWYSTEPNPNDPTKTRPKKVVRLEAE